jgi:hypothetical protein
MLAIFSLRDACGTVNNGSETYITVKYKVLAALPIYRVIKKSL